MTDEPVVEHAVSDRGLSRVIARRASLAGRPVTSTSTQRYIDTRREQAKMRLWKKTPDVVLYVCRVALGLETFDEGRLKAATLILSRTMPTISSQVVEATSTSVSARVAPAGLEIVARKLIAEIQTNTVEAVDEQ